jgi:hypothetical protein
MELEDLTMTELWAVLRHVKQHKDQAVILEDKSAEDNAQWLIDRVQTEIKGRQ